MKMKFLQLQITSMAGGCSHTEPPQARELSVHSFINSCEQFVHVRDGKVGLASHMTVHGYLLKRDVQRA